MSRNQYKKYNARIFSIRSVSDNVVQSRRDFLKTAGNHSALAAALGIGITGSLLVPTDADEIGPLKPNRRRAQAFRLPKKAAREYLHEHAHLQHGNGDEDLYDDRRASFSKCLPHNDLC